MKKMISIFIIFFCLVILVISYLAWKDKIQAAANHSIEETNLKLKNKESDKTVLEDPVQPKLDIDSLTSGMDEKVSAIFRERYQANEPLKLLIVGSDAMESTNPGYASQAADSIKENFKEFVEVKTISFEGTSNDFIEQGIDLSPGYDIVLLEPFTLNNNGLVEIEREHEHILEFLSRLQEIKPDAAIVLHPPQPIYGAQYYVTQVKALEEFALQQDFAYINHWPAWPDTTDPALEQYLTEDGSPNTEGSKIWADELAAYFVKE